MRIEPPWSPPIAMSHSPAATSAAPPAIFPRVVHRQRLAGVAAARQAEALADRLADDLAAGVEDAGDQGRVDVGHIAFERRRAVHHRQAGDADIVLDDDRLAGQRAARLALDRGLPGPGVEPVLVMARAIAAGPRI